MPTPTHAAPPTNTGFSQMQLATAKTVQFQDGDLLMEVSGQLKFDTLEKVQREILAEIEKSTVERLLLDCARVEFVDSQALALLLSISRRVRQNKGELILLHPRPIVRKLLALTRLDMLFQVIDAGEPFA